MEFISILFICLLVLTVLFIILHLQPLTEDEIKSLAKKRRKKSIRSYFVFINNEYSANADFKKQMNANGNFYHINEQLLFFPSSAAALLKYKKHEWIIIAFEKDKKIDLMWLNKGFDRSSVSSYLSAEDIVYRDNLKEYTSVLMFHNHPNSAPQYYDCSKPSLQDITSAIAFAKTLNQNDINLLEFVCERGRHYQYFISPADTFMPLSDFIIEVEAKNGLSKWCNFKLQVERVF